MDRERMVEVLVHHWQTPTSGCGCGGMKLGESYPEHVVDVYEQADEVRRHDSMSD